MVIKITDPRLLEKTGGIVQGMSGSPIIQDGKLVGAVTHVFVHDPTRGYGCFIDWMLMEAGILPKKERAGLSFGSFFAGARGQRLGTRGRKTESFRNTLPASGEKHSSFLGLIFLTSSLQPLAPKRGT